MTNEKKTVQDIGTEMHRAIEKSLLENGEAFFTTGGEVIDPERVKIEKLQSGETVFSVDNDPRKDLCVALSDPGSEISLMRLREPSYIHEPVEPSSFGTIDMVVESPTGRKSYNLGVGRLYFDPLLPPSPPEPGASGKFSASFTTDFLDTELHALAYNAALGIAIKSDRRWEKITRLMFSRDPRQRKRGYRLYDKG